MRADQVQVSWNADKSKWLVRIQAGEEVIQRSCHVAQNADDQALRQAVESVMRDEGYEPDLGRLTISR
jgi:hypothetical protein